MGFGLELDFKLDLGFELEVEVGVGLQPGTDPTHDLHLRRELRKEHGKG